MLAIIDDRRGIASAKFGRLVMLDLVSKKVVGEV